MKITAKELRIEILFLLPALIIYSVYFVLPVPLAGFYSFFSWSGLSNTKTFVGLHNWIVMFHDKVFLKSLGNNLTLIFYSLAVQLSGGLFLALFLKRNLRGAGLFRIVYFIPMMISAVAIGLSAQYIFDTNLGLVNMVLEKMGMGAYVRSWLGDARYAFSTVASVICWQYIPYYMIIYSAALTTIPADLYEAARIDGASSLSSFWTITVPFLSNTIKSTIILIVVGSLKYFGLIFVMTEGGPNHSSELLATYMYKQAFTRQQMGYGSTIAFFMFILSLGLTVMISSRKTKAEAIYE